MTTDHSALRSLFSVWPNLRRADGRALSVYVPARSEGYDARYYDIVFGDLLHRYRERLGDAELDVMKNELPRLRAHLASVRPAGGAALAGFSEASCGLLELLKLPERAEERLEVGELLLAPVLRQLERFPPSLVVVADRRHVMTFALVLDELRRHRSHRSDAALDEAASDVEREMGSGAYARVFVAGPAVARVQLERLLPRALRDVTVELTGVSLDSAHVEADIHRRLTALRMRVAG